MPRYTFSRASIIDEIFIVDAPDEDTALEMVQDGAPSVKLEQGEWIDWYHEEYDLVHTEDELVTFIQSKETV